LLLIGPALLCIILTRIFWLSYENDKKSIEESAIRKIEAVARTLVNQIDGDAHEKLAQTYTQKDAFDSATAPQVFLDLVEPLKFAHKINQLETDIYTVRLADSLKEQITNTPNTYRTFGSEFILMSGPNPYYRHPNPYWALMGKVFFDKEIVNTPVYVDSTGVKWFSTLVPIFNSQEQVVAMLGADVKMDNLYQEKWTTFLKKLVLFLMLILIIIISVGFVFKSQINMNKLSTYPKFNPNMLLEIKTNGKVTYINPVGKIRFPDIVDQGLKHPFLKGADEIINNLKNNKYVMFFRKIEINEVHYDQKFIYLQEYDSVRVYSNDITQQVNALTAAKEANQELKDTQSQLVQSEKLASMGMLVAGIAHEINTPVGAIISSQDTVSRALKKLETTLDEEEQKKECNPKLAKIFTIIHDSEKIISSASQRVAKIVAQLKRFARLDQAELQTVDIHECIDDTLGILNHQIKNQIEIVQVIGKIPLINCFPGGLNQVFLNILTNAIHAIKPPGKITIETKITKEDLNILIQDSGSGVKPENISKLFDPGFTTKGVGVGSGLGLSISYKIIKNHHGNITVESTLGKGTTFTITIPLDLGKRIKELEEVQKT